MLQCFCFIAQSTGKQISPDVFDIQIFDYKGVFLQFMVADILEIKVRNQMLIGYINLDKNKYNLFIIFKLFILVWIH